MNTLLFERADPTLSTIGAPLTSDAPLRAVTRCPSKLPPARDLAANLGVSTNAAPHDLRLLSEARHVKFRRGHGITDAGSASRCVRIWYGESVAATPGSSEINELASRVL